jgi:hypothetical protein
MSAFGWVGWVVAGRTHPDGWVDWKGHFGRVDHRPIRKPIQTVPALEVRNQDLHTSTHVLPELHYVYAVFGDIPVLNII